MTAKRRRRPGRYVNRNRQWGARQNTFSISLKSSVAIVAVVAVLVCRLVGTQARDAVQDEILREESRQQSLQEQLQRETAVWAGLRTPRSLAASLAAHGVAMSQPRASQRIAMSGAPRSRAANSGVYAANR